MAVGRGKGGEGLEFSVIRGVAHLSPSSSSAASHFFHDVMQNRKRNLTANKCEIRNKWLPGHMCVRYRVPRHMCEFAFARTCPTPLAAGTKATCVHAAAADVGYVLCRAEYGRWEQIGFAFASRALRASLPFPGWGLHMAVHASHCDVYDALICATVTCMLAQRIVVYCRFLVVCINATCGKESVAGVGLLSYVCTMYLLWERGGWRKGGACLYCFSLETTYPLSFIWVGF